jgi:hypothetical protein
MVDDTNSKLWENNNIRMHNQGNKNRVQGAAGVQMAVISTLLQVVAATARKQVDMLR